MIGSELLAIYEPTRTLRLGGNSLLVEPKTRLAKMGDRAFSNYASRLWNQLPSHIKASPLVQTFEKNLKTHFFMEGFPIEFLKNVYLLLPLQQVVLCPMSAQHL